MIRKLLIANRGEIAVRIVRAARELGISTVQAVSAADRDMLAARMADEIVEIGPAHATKSYLSGAAILHAARMSGADAIHPGYGFLSENADFAQAVEGGGSHLRRPAPGDDPHDGRQGARAPCGGRGWRADRSRHGQREPRRRGAGGGGGAARLSGHGQGGGGRRRPRHPGRIRPRDAPARADRGAHGSQSGVRRRQALSRALPAARAPHRSPGARRRSPGRASVRAGMLGSAPPSKDLGRSAGPPACPRRCGGSCAPPPFVSPRRSATAAPARWSICSTRTRGASTSSK